MAQEGPPIKGTQHKKTPCSCNPCPTVVYLPQHCLGIYDKSIPTVSFGLNFTPSTLHTIHSDSILQQLIARLRMDLGRLERAVLVSD